MGDIDGDFNITLEYDSYYNEMLEEKGRIGGVRMVVMLSMAGLMTLASLACNGLVLGVVVRRPRLHNFPYIIIACIAIIDILNSFWEIWYIIIGDGYFFFKPVCCKLITFIPYFLYLLVPLCLTALAVVHWKVKKTMQFGKERDVKRSVFVVFFLCLLSAIFSYPVFHFATTSDNGLKSMCVIDFPSWNAQQIYHAVHSLFSYGVCSIVVIPSLLIAKRGRDKEVVEVDEEGEVVEKKEQLDKRFESMIIVIWIIFVLFGVAFEIMILFSYFTWFKEVNILITYLPVLYKFFLYRGMDQNFRNELSALFTRSV